MISFLKFIAIVGAAFFGVFGSLVSSRDKNGKITTLGVLSIGGILICALLAFLLGVHDDRVNEKNEEQKVRLLTKVDTLTDEIVELSKVNSELSNKILNYQTGGSSIPVVSFAFLSPNSGLLLAGVEGVFPLKNVGINIRDQYDIEKISVDGLSFEEIFNKVIGVREYFEPVDLVPGKSIKLGKFSLPNNRAEVLYIIESLANNGNFTQIVKFKKNNQIWGQSNIVYKNYLISDTLNEVYRNVDSTYLTIE